MPKRTLDYDRFSSSFNLDLTWKINGIISNKTFSRKQKPQYGDPDKFSSKPRRKTKILAPSIKISTPVGCRMPAFTTPQSRSKNVYKDMLWIYWKPKRRFSWPNNEKLQREGNNHFLSE